MPQTEDLELGVRWDKRAGSPSRVGQSSRRLQKEYQDVAQWTVGIVSGPLMGCQETETVDPQETRMGVLLTNVDEAGRLIRTFIHFWNHPMIS